MSNQAGTGRPRNPDGTVNWSVVFDDPDRGILAAIGKATTVKHLEGLVAQFGPLLFQRKNDAKDLAAFNEIMNSILRGAADSGFDATQIRLRDVLEAEKNTRIKKAEEYIANKRAGQSIDRREESWSFGIKNAFFGTPVRIFSALGVLLIVISLGVLSQIDFDSSKPEKEATAEEEKPAPSEDAKVEPDEPKWKMTKSKEKVYPVFLMKPILVQTSQGRQSLVPVIVAPSLEEASIICRLAPKFAESVLFKTSVASESNDILKSDVLTKISSSLRADTNAYLKDQFIKAIYLVNTQKLDRQALRASYRGCGKHNLKTDPKDLHG